MWDKKYTEELRKKIDAAFKGGGIHKTEKQHSQGKLTARERIDYLFDKNSFYEVGTIREPKALNELSKSTTGDGVITGYGSINGRIVYAASQDFTVNGGTLGAAHAEKICRIMDMAINSMCPFISINDSGGARIEEGIASLAGYSGIFYRNTAASGVIPQISVIMGPCAGGACYSPAITDFIFMVKNTSQMFITGPDVIKTVTGETTSVEELGGAKIHECESGVAHFVYENDFACLDGVKRLLKYLPQNNLQKTESIFGKAVDKSCEIEHIVPDNMSRPYDVKDVINTFVDRNTFFEIQKSFAKNLVIGLAFLDGEAIGIVANQPQYTAGALDADASDKAARFVRFCDCFNIPLLSLVDVPGYLPGISQEHNGIIRHGAKLLFAFSEATVPKVCLIMRKAFGGAYIAMNSRNIGADIVFAWPIAQIAVMGAEGAVDIIYKKRLKECDNPEEMRKKFTDEYSAKYLNPFLAAAAGYIDEVIEVNETRKKICMAFTALKEKKQGNIWKKHGNIPL